MEIKKIQVRICESSWHKKIKLKKFEKCSICCSEAYHLYVGNENQKV